MSDTTPRSPAPVDWSPQSWQSRVAAQQPDWPDTAELDAALKVLSGYPPLVFAGESRALTGCARRRGRGTGVPAAGRRLRRVVRGVLGGLDPRAAQGHPADGGGADLLRRRADREGRPHRGAVREAALLGHRDDRRRRAAQLPRSPGERHRVHRSGAHPGARIACCRRTTSRRPR